MAATTNGHVSEGRLQKLLVWYEQRTEAIRMVLSLLQAEAGAAKQGTAKDVLAQALTLDHERRERVGKGHDKASIIARRQETATFLDGLKAGERVSSAGRGKGFGGLLQSGYFRKLANGEYARTAKRFHVHRPNTADETAAPAQNKPTRKRKYYAASTRQRREKTAALLAGFKTNDVIDTDALTAPGTGGSIGMLSRYHYIRKTPKGWVRTAKPFVANETTEE